MRNYCNRRFESTHNDILVGSLKLAHVSIETFMQTIETIINNPETSAVHRERLVDTVATAYAQQPPSDTNGKSHQPLDLLWRNVGSFSTPNVSIAFEPEEATSNTLAPRSRESSVATPLPSTSAVHAQTMLPVRRSLPQPEEDMRRRFEQCEFDRGNAKELLRVLKSVPPEQLREHDAAKELYSRCLTSQERISTQISRASASADRTRNEGTSAGEQTQEHLLGILLATEQELLQAIRMFDDLQRIAAEREAEGQSRVDLRANRHVSTLSVTAVKLLMNGRRILITAQTDRAFSQSYRPRMSSRAPPDHRPHPHLT